MRVIVLTGARQCGKTTLAQSMANPADAYYSLDDSQLLQEAQLDPHGFVKHAQAPFIIDEIQRAPQLILAIKIAVDADPRAGRFLLTGSSNILHLPKIPDSLAGRASYMRLRPLTQGEILSPKPTFFERLQGRDLSGYENILIRQDLIRLAFRGGYPAVLSLSESERAIWVEDYIQTLITRDLKDIAAIRPLEPLEGLIKLLAAWSSQFVDVSSLARTLGASRPIINTYITALEYMYLVEKIPHWL